MQIPLQITFRDLPRSDAVESRISGKVAKLERFYPRIDGCRVVVNMTRKQNNQGKLFNVRIDLTVPQAEIVVTRHADEDVYVAIRDAFDAVGRRLQDFARKQRADVKQHEEPIHGRVARVFVEEDRGYGFIETEDGREYYFSNENMTEPEFAILYPGAEVQFIKGSAAEGQQAKRVSVGKHHEP